MRRYKLLFKGRVQGVGFRYTSKMLADKLNLTGTIENLYNGDVECYIQGSEQNIDKFIQDMKNQRYIRIESIDKTQVVIVEGEMSYKIIG